MPAMLKVGVSSEVDRIMAELSASLMPYDAPKGDTTTLSNGAPR